MGSRNTTRKKRRPGSRWAQSSARPSPRRYWQQMPTATYTSVTTRVPGRPPGLRVRTVSQTSKPAPIAPKIRQNRPAGRRGDSHHPQEVRLLAPNQQLAVVEPADKGDLEAALNKLEP